MPGLFILFCLYPTGNGFRLADHIPGNETVFNLIAILHRVVVDAPFERLCHFRFTAPAKPAHILHIHAAVPVERRGKGILGSLHTDIFHIGERHRTVEDIRLDEQAVFSTLQREDVPSCGIHQDHLGILSCIEVAIAHHELIVMSVQILTVQPVFFPVLRFIGIQPLIRVPYLNI